MDMYLAFYDGIARLRANPVDGMVTVSLPWIAARNDAGTAVSSPSQRPETPLLDGF
jgi:hypothetical protein